MKHHFNISIEATTPQEAEAKVKAAVTLLQKLKANELARLADVVKNDPVKTAFAKKALGL